MSDQWYALHSKPLKEGMVCQQLEALGIPVFYPRLCVQPANPRSRRVRPYFPGYMFVRADLTAIGRSLFRHLPHAIGLVCCGEDPVAVPDKLVAAIHDHVVAVNAAGGELFYQLQHGDRVTIERGPFTGCAAIFDLRLRGTDRVRVLLEMIDQQLVPLELPAGFIQPNLHL